MQIDSTKLYRLPWNLADNASTWLEVTTSCDLKCLGCYRENTHTHKSLSEIKEELAIIKKTRKTDSIAIAGGEPLLHPDLINIVSLIKTEGWKPCLVTNGNVISEDILGKLKKAGLYKISFHVDSKQGRPGWEKKNEEELNQLRMQYAQLVYGVGGVNCNFIATIYPDTLNELEKILSWAKRNISIVNALHFTCHRTASSEFDYFAQGKKVDIDKTAYILPEVAQKNIDILQITEKIKNVYLEFEPSAFLNGTEKADSFKWLFGGVVGDERKIYGYIGPKTMETIQIFYHYFRGRYFSAAYPSRLGAWTWLSWMWIFDVKIRRIFVKIFQNFKPPFKRLYLQIISIVQPIDILPDGRQNMCDGCPDQTVWNGQLVYSCRMDENIKFGCLCQTCPKEK